MFSCATCLWDCTPMIRYFETARDHTRLSASIPSQVSHEFALNLNPANPYVAGVEGIVAAYKQSLARVELWGPTNFAPIIQQVSRFAHASRSNPAKHGREYVPDPIFSYDHLSITNSTVVGQNEECNLGQMRPYCILQSHSITFVFLPAFTT